MMATSIPQTEPSGNDAARKAASSASHSPRLSLTLSPMDNDVFFDIGFFHLRDFFHSYLMALLPAFFISVARML